MPVLLCFLSKLLHVLFCFHSSALSVQIYISMDRIDLAKWVKQLTVIFFSCKITKAPSIQIRLLLKPHIFETHLQSGFFWIWQVWWICVDDWNVNFVINSGPVNENFQVENGRQQCSVCEFFGSNRQSYCMHRDQFCYFDAKH